MRSLGSAGGQRVAQEPCRGDDHLEHVTRRRIGVDDEIERQVGTARLSRYLPRVGKKVMGDDRAAVVQQLRPASLPGLSSLGTRTA